MQEDRQIGVIGLGDLGQALTRRLVRAGHRAALYDLDGEKRRAFTPNGPFTYIAPGLTDLGHDCTIVFSALPDIATLRTAAFGDADRPGVALAMQTGSLIVHFGGGPYKDILRMTGQLGSVGIGLIDVLTCRALKAETHQPAEMLVGGFDEIVERARPALEAIGPFQRIGATGAATGLAALRSYVRAARLIALSEAILIGRHAGIDTDTLARVFDGPVATGPECRAIVTAAGRIDPAHDLTVTSRALTDAVSFSEHIGVSGECVAFARDMLADAVTGHAGGNESTLLHHFTALASGG